jgi:hypothetical protein
MLQGPTGCPGSRVALGLESTPHTVCTHALKKAKLEDK